MRSKRFAFAGFALTCKFGLGNTPGDRACGVFWMAVLHPSMGIHRVATMMATRCQSLIRIWFEIVRSPQTWGYSMLVGHTHATLDHRSFLETLVVAAER